jgi:L-arabinose isomerase
VLAAQEPRIERRKPLKARIGIVGVGHHVYWAQFEGLLDELKGKMARLEKKVQAHGVETVTFGILDKAQDAWDALPKMKAADLDVLFIDMVTYATSSTFAPIARDLHVPIVLVALQPLKAMPYAKATTRTQLCNDDFCSVPEFTGVAIRLGKPVADVILGVREGDAAADRALEQWCRIARVLHDLRRARIGLMGHVLESMYDMHADPTAITAAFGCHVALCEPDEILKHYLAEDRPAVEAKKKVILDFFDTPDPVSDPITMKLTDHDLEVAARAAVALDKFTAARNLDGLAYYYEALPDTPMRELVTNLIVGNSLLTGAGFPMCGEYDLKNCVAMLILDRLGIGGSFAEFHPVDFERDSVLVGHDGPHHLNIASRKPVLRSLKTYHGKPGKGAGVEFSIKEGPITMLSIGVKADGKMKFVIAEGESVAGPIPPTGNTNTHGKFKPDARTFLLKWVEQGPTHHFALGTGHHADDLLKIARVLGLEAVVVTPRE